MLENNDRPSDWVVDASTSSLMTDAFELACQYEISACDASYVSLAQRLELSLVTADSKLVNKLRSSGDTVLFLAEVL